MRRKSLLLLGLRQIKNQGCTACLLDYVSVPCPSPRHDPYLDIDAGSADGLGWEPRVFGNNGIPSAQPVRGDQLRCRGLDGAFSVVMCLVSLT